MRTRPVATRTVSHGHGESSRLVSLSAQRIAWLGAGSRSHADVPGAGRVPGIVRPDEGRAIPSRLEPETDGTPSAASVIINASGPSRIATATELESRSDMNPDRAFALIRRPILTLRPAIGAGQ